MFGNEPPLDDLVESIVRDWQPRQRYGREHEYKTDLEGYLETELNAPDPEPPYAVATNRSRSACDIVVDDTVGVELKRNPDSAAVDRLRGELETYLDRYAVVIVCACGIDDASAWQRLEREYNSGGGGGLLGLGGSDSPVVFVTKRP